MILRVMGVIAGTLYEPTSPNLRPLSLNLTQRIYVYQMYTKLIQKYWWIFKNFDMDWQIKTTSSFEKITPIIRILVSKAIFLKYNLDNNCFLDVDVV